MAKAKSNLDKLLALPYVHLKDGKVYIRVPYKRDNGTWGSKEKLLPADATPDDAIVEIANIKTKLLKAPQLLDGERMLFEDLVVEYQRAYPKVKTWYLEPLTFFRGRKVISITYTDCRRFKEARQAVGKRSSDPTEFIPRQVATINREVETLRSVLLFAVRHGWLARTPFTAGEPLIRKSEEARRTRLPTPEEEARLLSVCTGKRQHLRALIIATRDTGLRRSAIRELDFSMLKWEIGVLEVPAGNRHKGRPSCLALTARLRVEIERIWEEKGRPMSGKIFDQVADFKRSYRTACRLAGITGLRYNDLRHGFATDLMEADVSKRLAMKVAGHRNEEIHDIYTNVDARLALEIASALDKLHQSRFASL